MTLDAFKALVEQRLAACHGLDTAPCWLSNHEAQAWEGGKAAALQWVLEMLPSTAEWTAEREPNRVPSNIDIRPLIQTIARQHDLRAYSAAVMGNIIQVDLAAPADLNLSVLPRVYQDRAVHYKIVDPG